MKTLLAAALVCFVLPVLAEDKKEPKKPTGFQNLSYEKAIEAAKKEKKIVMVDFSTSWCGFCKKLDAETFSNDKVKTFLKEKTIAIKVDGDKEKDLVRKYGIRGYPTLVFVDSEGKEVGRLV